MKNFFKAIGGWLGRFFAVDNSVNENTVMGVIFSIVVIVGGFTGVPEFVFFGWIGLIVGFFSINFVKL